MTLNESVWNLVSSRRNFFVRLDDYFRWCLKLHYDVGPFVHLEGRLLDVYMLMGGHPATVTASIGMRDGIVWSKGFWVTIETYARGFNGERSEYALAAEVYSVPRLGLSGNSVFHKDYEIGRPGGCEICVMGWVKFTPYAAAADIRQLTQIDLTCLTRWHPCETQADIMPAAWKQYLREWPQQGPVACSPSIIEHVGRDSAYVAVGEVVQYNEEAKKDPVLGDTGNVRLRVLQILKGPAPYAAGEIRDVFVYVDVPKKRKFRRGSRLVFWGRYPKDNASIDLHYPCAPILANEANLRLIRSGIDQDYSAKDNE